MKKALLVAVICASQIAYVAAETPHQNGSHVVRASDRPVTMPVQYPGPIGPAPFGGSAPFSGPAPFGGPGPWGGPMAGSPDAGPVGIPPNGGWMRNANTDLYSTLPPGWPAVGVTRRDYKHPDPNAQFRDSGIEVRVPAMSRVYIDDEEIQPREGKYRFAPDHGLIPGTPYVYRVRVETQNELGMVSVRAVSVYLRMGRITVLTFE